MNAGEDPGWRPAFLAMIPFAGHRSSRRRRLDGLIAIRCVFIGLVAGLLLFVWSLSYLFDGPGEPGAAPLVIVGTGVASNIGLTLLSRRRLSTSSLRSLSDSWRARLFIGVALAELPALFGFTAAVITEAIWVYLIGMGFSLVGLWRVAPSRKNLARDQDEIRSAGSPLDLTEAIMTAGPYAPPPSSGSPP